MQATSSVHKSIVASGNYWTEVGLYVGGAALLINEENDVITFGNDSIKLFGRNVRDDGYRENMLISLKTSNRVFSGETPNAGDCVSGEIDIEMWNPISAKDWGNLYIVPYVRVTDGTRYGTWLPMGYYYIDTREVIESSVPNGRSKLVIHGYDSMLKHEREFTGAGLSWPAKDIDVVRAIAGGTGFVSDNTEEIMNKNYRIQLPSGYSEREVLGYIAAMYGGCFVYNAPYELELIQLGVLPSGGG